MDLHQARLALLKLTCLVLVGTSWLFSGFLLESRPEPEDLVDADPLNALVRLPASLPAQLPAKIPGVFGPENKPAEPVRMDVMSVPCWDKTGRAPQKTDSRWIRLTGRPCQSDASADAVTVTNLANGYTGTVFNATPSSLTTDYIPLESGENELLVRIQTGQGEPVETRITFNR